MAESTGETLSEAPGNDKPPVLESAGDSAARTANALSDNPLALVAGGVALGVVVGMLLPRLDRERELLAPVGKRLADTTGSAARAARETGKREIDALLADADATKGRVGQVFSNVVAAAKDAGVKAK